MRRIHQMLSSSFRHLHRTCQATQADVCQVDRPLQSDGVVPAILQSCTSRQGFHLVCNGNPLSDLLLLHGENLSFAQLRAKEVGEFYLMQSRMEAFAPCETKLAVFSSFDGVSHHAQGPWFPDLPVLRGRTRRNLFVFWWTLASKLHRRAYVGDYQQNVIYSDPETSNNDQTETSTERYVVVGARAKASVSERASASVFACVI